MVDNSERSIALVVEDDPWIRLPLRDLLTDAEYAVLEASNGPAPPRCGSRNANRRRSCGSISSCQSNRVWSC
jgi:hypothetical protein